MAPAPQDAAQPAPAPQRQTFQGQLWEWNGTTWEWVRAADDAGGAAASSTDSTWSGTVATQAA
eukprot:7923292-Lingulodinium_polyedra.AAC.1